MTERDVLFSTVNRKHPDHAALGHDCLFTLQGIDCTLHARSIYTPARLNRDVLDTVDFESGRHSCDTGIQPLFPQHLAIACVKSTEVTIGGSAAEHETTAGSQHGTPVGHVVFMRPDFFAGVDVPGLQFADMIRTFTDAGLNAGCPGEV